MERQLRRSSDIGEKLEMIYQAADGSLSQRIILVKAFDQHRVLAYCYFRKSNRIFRLDRILSIQRVRKRQVQ